MNSRLIPLAAQLHKVNLECELNMTCITSSEQDQVLTWLNCCVEPENYIINCLISVSDVLYFFART